MNCPQEEGAVLFHQKLVQSVAGTRADWPPERSECGPFFSRFSRNHSLSVDSCEHMLKQHCHPIGTVFRLFFGKGMFP